MADEVLTCTRCGETKPATEFPTDNRNTSRRRSSFCKACHIKASVAWQKANPDKVKVARLRRYAVRKDEIQARRRQRYSPEKAKSERLFHLYGMSLVEYNSILEDQGGRCAICNRHHSEFTRALSVDHDHACCPTSPTCGKCNRGLLCHTCNTALHALETRRGWIEAAAKYLQKEKSN